MNHESRSLKVLHILNDGGDALSERIVAAQSSEHAVHVIDLTRADTSYERLVEEIFAHDRVISW